MHIQSTVGRRTLLAALLTVLAAAPAGFAQANSYVQHNLVSDLPGADHIDANLVNPWALCFSGTSPFWVSNNGTGTSTLYNGFGELAPLAGPLVVKIPRPASATGSGNATPTGCVQNAVTPGFAVKPGTNASFIFSTEDGTIVGWASAPGALVLADNSATSVYKGLAQSTVAGAGYLYAANFRTGKIDVFDTNYAKATLQGAFTDPNIPPGFAPFNIQALGGKLYVTYAMQDASKHDDVAGAGNGIVSVFDTSGDWLGRLVTNAQLNSPWGLAIAPASFGAFAGNLLVGNFGDGKINAFDVNTGAYKGTLQDSAGKAIVISGLWALAFGNTNAGSDPSILFFTAGPVAETHGLFGTLQVTSTLGVPMFAANALVNGASFSAPANLNGSVAPGSMAALFGTNLTSVVMNSNGSPVPTTLGDTNSVVIGNTAAPLFFVGPKQINLQIPYEVTPGTQNVVVKSGGQSSAAQTVVVVPASPGIFSSGQTGAGQGAILNLSGALVNASAPAAAGDYVSVYCTGLGATKTAVATGAAAPLTPPIATNLVVTATIGGLPATVVFSGLAPTFVGLYQVNVQVPAGLTSGAAVPVVLTVNGVASNSVTMVAK